LGPQHPTRQQLRNRWLVATGTLFVAALVWRLFYLARLGETPLAGSLTLDSRLYWNWAAFLIQHGPVGKNPFFFGPLYPYVLWPIRAVFGDAIQPLLVIQAIGGATAAVLLADAARHLTRPSIGLAIGVIAAFYEMCVFFDGLVLMESLLFLLESLLLWVVVRTHWPERRLVMYLTIGILIALLAEGRAISAVLLIPAWLLLVRATGEPLSTALRRAATLCLGFAIIVVPVFIRNKAVSGEWIPFTYNLGYNLYVGNSPEATGGWVVTTGVTSGALQAGEDGGVESDGRADLAATKGLKLTAAGSSRYWTEEALHYARTHPLRTARLILRKVGMMWNVREYPQIENADEYRELAGPLGLPLVGTFAFLGPLALAGLLLAPRRAVAGRFLVWYACLMTAVTVPFFVTDRYRHHLIPGAVLLAAITGEELLIWLRKREKRNGVLLIGGLAMGVVATRLPAPGLSAAGYAWGMAVDLGTRWEERGRPDLAVRAFEQAIAIESRSGRMVAGRTGAAERADLYYEYGNALVQLGREAEALPWYERAVREAPDHTVAMQALALAYRRAGRSARADSLEQALEGKAGGAAMAAVNRGWQAAREGRLSEAERLFRQAVEANPRLTSAWTALIRLQVQSGRLSQARASMDRAKAAGLTRTEADVYEALLAVMEGDLASARTLLAGVPEAALRSDPVLADVARIVRERTGAPSP
jgi:tetratricopeptide (TPR) repeat protein